MKIYSYKTADKIRERLLERAGAFVYEIPGALVDNYIMGADGCYTFIVREKYLNMYSSGVTIRKYRKIPAKYQKIIELFDDCENEKAEKLFFV